MINGIRFMKPYLWREYVQRSHPQNRLSNRNLNLRFQQLYGKLVHRAVEVGGGIGTPWPYATKIVPWHHKQPAEPGQSGG